MARFLWTQKEDIGPSPRVGHALAHDTARKQTLLFGGDGLGAALLSDTWSWDGDFWTQRADTGPSGRRDHAMAFDSARNSTLLFGGGNGRSPLRDSWSWNGGDWTQVEDSGPSARHGHAMAFDAVRGRVVLFGGNDGNGTALGDSWEWDGDGWTQVEDSGPSPRHNIAMAYDLVRQRVLLFGGDRGDGTALGDTWTWDGQSWTQVADIGPPPMLRSAMVSTDAQPVLFGGLSRASGTPAPIPFDDSWVFDGTHWTQRQDMGPAGRWGHGLAFDPARRTIVMFGGYSSGTFGQPADLLGDTWEHVETEPAPSPQPGGVSEANVVVVALSPVTALPGTPIAISFQLDLPATGPTEVRLAWIRQSVWDAATGNGTPIPDSELNWLPSVIVPPGEVIGGSNFIAPGVGTNIYVAAATGQSHAVALLQIS